MALVCAGVIGLGVVEAREDEDLRAARQEASNYKYSKSFLALALPVAQGHGENVEQGHREVGEDDGQTDLRAAHKDLVGRLLAAQRLLDKGLCTL